MSLYLLDTFRFPTIGEVEFACSDTEYLWQVPVGVTSITCVLVGGGGGGRAGANQNDGAGGGGGALRWVNHMVVTPGEILQIKVGLGGTGCPTRPISNSGRQFSWGRPGQHSYIASTNNQSVPARAGIGSTMIVVAEGGGWDYYVSDQIRVRPGTTTEINETTTSLNNAVIQGTSTVGSRGGQGTIVGSYSWGTVGGGNGGNGGTGDGVGGGQDGGGGGAGGYNGNGGTGGTASGIDATSGSGGGGGGGMFGGGGGADGGGGGGGVGVFWGSGPNGIRGGYYYDTGTLQTYFDNNKTSSATGAGGQAGSFGADGRATGCDVVSPVQYINSTPIPPVTNYPNQSIGNGLRGFNSAVDDVLDETIVAGDGGSYGGGGGAAQTGGGSQGQAPRSGNGACGRVRILWAVRTDIVFREYGANRGIRQISRRNGQPIMVEYHDWNTTQNVTTNVNNGWPAWSPEPAAGVSYNFLVNWASNLVDTPYLPPVITAGISSNPSGYSLPT